jgi:hypothetical protein
MAIVHLLRMVDPSITTEWFFMNGLQCAPQSTIKEKPVLTPRGTRIKLKYWCSGLSDPIGAQRDVLGLHLRVLPDSVSDALRVLPALDHELVASLRSLEFLQTLVMEVGSGTLLPQLASLASLEVMEFHHYCLRGPIPENLFTDMPNLRRLVVTPASAARQANDPNVGVCGVSGRLQNNVLPSSNPTELSLSYNQLTGELPSRLLYVANKIALQGNKSSGSIPAGTPTDITTALDKRGVRVESLDLSHNSLHVWSECLASRCYA